MQGRQGGQGRPHRRHRRRETAAADDSRRTATTTTVSAGEQREKEEQGKAPAARATATRANTAATRTSAAATSTTARRDAASISGAPAASPRPRDDRRHAGLHRGEEAEQSAAGGAGAANVAAAQGAAADGHADARDAPTAEGEAAAAAVQAGGAPQPRGGVRAADGGDPVVAGAPRGPVRVPLLRALLPGLLRGVQVLLLRPGVQPLRLRAAAAAGRRGLPVQGLPHLLRRRPLGRVQHHVTDPVAWNGSMGWNGSPRSWIGAQ